VDEYGLALEQALRALLPGWVPASRRLRAKLSHDLDFVGIPFSLRSALGHAIYRRRPAATIRDIAARFTAVEPAYLSAVTELAQLSLQRGLDSAFYWKASPPGPHDSGYDPRHPKLRRAMVWLTEHGFENGIHPGYETWRDRDRLRSEVELLQSVLQQQRLGGRQHFLRWCPETWVDWEACGLAYDSTLGFADAIGFRAGTCIPYRPWIASLNREVNLLEIPLIVMDLTPLAYMQLSLPEALAAILRCIDACRLVGGVFTLLWHNTTLLNPAFGNLYRELLDHLQGAEKYDWRSDVEQTVRCQS
jgi:hypothetical protein